MTTSQEIADYVSGLTDADRSYAAVLSATLETQRSSRMLLSRMVESRSSA